MVENASGIQGPASLSTGRASEGFDAGDGAFPNIVAALEPSRLPDVAKHVRTRHRSGNVIYNTGAFALRCDSLADAGGP